MGIWKCRVEPNMLGVVFCEKLNKVTLISYLVFLIDINVLFLYSVQIIETYIHQNNYTFYATMMRR